MISADGTLQQCENCPETIPNHRWGKARAHDAGWFFTRDNKQAFCPNHTPDWVTAWRARKAERAEK